MSDAKYEKHIILFIGTPWPTGSVKTLYSIKYDPQVKLGCAFAMQWRGHTTLTVSWYTEIRVRDERAYYQKLLTETADFCNLKSAPQQAIIYIDWNEIKIALEVRKPFYY